MNLPPIKKVFSLGGSVPPLHVALLDLALALRLALMPWSFHPWEVQTWVNIGSDFYQGHNPYETGQELSMRVSSRDPSAFGYRPSYEYIAYLPIWPLILYPSYLVIAPERIDFAFGAQMPPTASPLAIFMLKVPIVFFDSAAAFVIFHLCRRLGITKPWLGVWLWLFNPLVITISAIWGHFEWELYRMLAKPLDKRVVIG